MGTGEIFGTLTVILALSFVVETLVEALFGRLADHVPALGPYKWALIYLAVVAGIGGAWVYRFDLLALLGQFTGAPVGSTPYGITLTGISIGMGAAYIHQFISKFFPKRD